MVRRLAVALALALAPVVARADIPPAPDSPDAHCTPAEQCPAGESCPYAFNPGAPEEEWKHVGEDCRAEKQRKGLELRCRDGGNYAGNSLYCPPGATGSWTPPGQQPPPVKATKAGMCSFAAVDVAGGPGLLALFLLLARRRRRR